MRRLIPCTLLSLAAIFSIAACETTTTIEVDDPDAPKEDASKVFDAGTTDEQNPIVGIDPDLQIIPTAAYTGFDGTRNFRVPIAVYGAKDGLTIKVSDPSVLDVKPAKLTNAAGDDGQWYLLTAKKAGVVDVTATYKSKSVKSRVTVQNYDPSRYTTGADRYTNGTGDVANKGKPCAACHIGNGAPDHSPMSLSGTDDELAKTVITNGIKGGVPITKLDHKWEATSEQLDGLVTYLRAIDPRGIELK
jgi:hypothetical protein